MPLYCKNCPKARKKTYTGKEPSPKGFGYCASCGSYGQEMLGLDGRLWIIRQRLNGSLYWAVANDTQHERPEISSNKEKRTINVSISRMKKQSPKRKSPKRKSPKRKSPKSKSPKTTSPKRKSPKRKSPKRKSPKRKSPKRKNHESKKKRHKKQVNPKKL